MLTNTDALVEENDFFLRGQALQWVRDLHINLELDDLAQLTYHDVVADMETEEEFAKKSLVLNDLIVDGLDDDSQHRWVLESKVLKFDLPLSYFMAKNIYVSYKVGILTEAKESLVVIDSFTWICSLFNHRRGNNRSS